MQKSIGCGVGAQQDSMSLGDRNELADGSPRQDSQQSQAHTKNKREREGRNVFPSPPVPVLFLIQYAVRSTAFIHGYFLFCCRVVRRGMKYVSLLWHSI